MTRQAETFLYYAKTIYVCTAIETWKEDVWSNAAPHWHELVRSHVPVHSVEKVAWVQVSGEQVWNKPEEKVFYTTQTVELVTTQYEFKMGLNTFAESQSIKSPTQYSANLLVSVVSGDKPLNTCPAPWSLPFSLRYQALSERMSGEINLCSHPVAYPLHF